MKRTKTKQNNARRQNNDNKNSSVALQSKGMLKSTFVSLFTEHSHLKIIVKIIKLQHSKYQL